MGSNGPPPKRKSSNENDLPISSPAPLTNGPKDSRIKTVKQEALINFLADSEIIGYAHRVASRRSYRRFFRSPDENSNEQQGD